MQYLNAVVCACNLLIQITINLDYQTHKTIHTPYEIHTHINQTKIKDVKLQNSVETVASFISTIKPRQHSHHFPG